MKEVKQPSKKPLVYYYLVALLILMVLNLTLFPAMLETPVQDVTYDQFMSMTYEQNVGQVQIEGDEITFTDKTNEKVYRTTATNDPDRTQRLYENGAQFQEIDTQPGLLTSILVGWVLPLLPFLLIGWFINRRMKKSMGGDGMMFGMGGGSNAKMYVSTLEEQALSPQTIRLRILALEKFSKWKKKPFELKRPKQQRKLETNNIPTEEEYNRLLEYLKTKKNKDYYFFIKVLGTTGARLSEFMQFTWEDIISGEVKLKGKGNKYRRFFFQDQLRKEAKAYVKETGKTGILAMGKYGKISSRGLSSDMKAWGKSCGIPLEKMHPHAFRHFFAKMFLKKNHDIVLLADLLGHANMDTTRIYLQKSYEEQKACFTRSVSW